MAEAMEPNWPGNATGVSWVVGILAETWAEALPEDKQARLVSR